MLGPTVKVMASGKPHSSDVLSGAQFTRRVVAPADYESESQSQHDCIGRGGYGKQWLMNDTRSGLEMSPLSSAGVLQTQCGPDSDRSDTGNRLTVSGSLESSFRSVVRSVNHLPGQ